MLSGPNIDAVVRLAKETNKRVIASGGIRSLDDLCSLKQFESDGVCGAIVGKALYTNQFTVAEALKAVGK